MTNIISHFWTVGFHISTAHTSEERSISLPSEINKGLNPSGVCNKFQQFLFGSYKNLEALTANFFNGLDGMEIYGMGMLRAPSVLKTASEMHITPRISQWLYLVALVCFRSPKNGFERSNLQVGKNGVGSGWKSLNSSLPRAMLCGANYLDLEFLSCPLQQTLISVYFHP